MSLDTLRPKAEAAKAWRPDRPTCDRTWSDRNQGAVMHCGLCDACHGAQRAVEDIEALIDRVLDFPPPQNSVCADLMVELASDAARISSYFCSEPNPVSEFRDAVKEAVK